MNKLLIRTAALGAVLCLCGIGRPIAAQDADILGEWDVSV